MKIYYRGQTPAGPLGVCNRIIIFESEEKNYPSAGFNNKCKKSQSTKKKEHL